MVSKWGFFCGLLAFCGPLRAETACFYNDAAGKPKPIACPEAGKAPPQLGPPAHGLVWRETSANQYQQEKLLRIKNGKLVPEDPNADPYNYLPMAVNPDGTVTKLRFQNAPLPATDVAPAQPPQQDAPAPGPNLLEQAEQALLDGRFLEAARDATESLEKAKTPQAYLVRASANNGLANYRLAVQDAEEGLKLAPGNQMLLQAQKAASASLEKQKLTEPPLHAPTTAPPAEAPSSRQKWNPQPAPRGGGGAAPFWIAFAVLTAILGAGGGFYIATRWVRRQTLYTSPDLSQPGLRVPTAPSGLATTGRLKGRFELRGKIGIGGMGIVFDGFDHSLGRRVAIKQMRSELKEFPEERAAFLSEARIISHLSHPYIVAFHDVIEENGEIYLVFDFVDGKPLSQILWERKRLPLKEVQQIYTYVCEAISCAHQNHVLHRDLKPANIMVDTAGYAKVMDFGIAREAKETITRLTHADTAGTPWYMAPEQHLGKCAKTSDIYALGVCLYESMTGKLPFPGPDFLAQKERMKYTPPQFLAPDLPKETELLFTTTLNPDPKKRVANAAELIDSLKSLKA